MNINITVDKKAQAVVDKTRCVNCGECERICPTGALREYQRAVTEACVSQEERRLATEMNCTDGCPLEISPQSLAMLVRNREYETAGKLIYDKNPLPWSVAAVCGGLCEERCKRGDLIDEPVNIPALERYVLAKTKPPKPFHTKKHYRKVAIIGGGPAGVSAAYKLSQLGYGVTIFERDNALGGAMNWGIPEFRLDKSKMREEIAEIISMGVEVRYGVDVGEDVSLDDLRSEGFAACLIAAGASQVVMSDIKGIEGADTYDAVSIIRKLNGCSVNSEAALGNNIFIFGREDLTLVAARLLARQGKHVVCAIAAEDDSPLFANQGVDIAAKEGIELLMMTTPKQIIREDDKLKAIELVKTEVETDETGQKLIQPVKGSEYNVFCDTVIHAMGTRSNVEKIVNAETFPDGKVRIDANHMTNKDMVFACGDVTGESCSVAEAVRSGLDAAEAIDNVIRGRAGDPGRERAACADDADAICVYDIPMFYPQKEGSSREDSQEFEDILPVLRAAGIDEDMSWYEAARRDASTEDSQKVAVIGGGISGITAALTLKRRGYKPTIFEKMPDLGGRYRWLASEHRIDQSLLRSELQKVESAGITVVCNVSAGVRPSLSDLFAEGYEAILLAIGESRGKKPDMRGVNARGVFDICALMSRLVCEEMIPDVGEHVILAGSDEMSIDTAIKLKEHCSDVTLAIPCSRGALRPLAQAIDAALDAGVNIMTGVSIHGISEEDGRVVGVECKIAENNQILEVPCDTFVLGETLAPDTEAIALRNLNIDIAESGHFETDEKLRTSIEGIFAIGDFDLSSSDAGRAGAVAISNYLSGENETIPVIHPHGDTSEEALPADYETIEGNKNTEIEIFERRVTFTDRQAEIEASRCMECGYCSANTKKCIGCGVCAKLCPANAIDMVPLDDAVERDTLTGESLRLGGEREVM